MNVLQQLFFKNPPFSASFYRSLAFFSKLSYNSFVSSPQLRQLAPRQRGRKIKNKGVCQYVFYK
jgi:hypothetical protein